MFTLTLSKDEQQALLELLECSLRELQSEIVRTDSHCFKKALKERKQVLISLLENVKQLQFSAS